ncbi:MAG: altronate dehydrogenase [Verrucomicrobiae bacterium]|nr:altronate dehydrogenase [Verrucomicrobiae bacterium]
MILQFGAGNFLRGFADLFLEELELAGKTPPGPIVVVQSTGHERAEALNRSGGRYHVAVQGFREGKIVDETLPVRSISRALHAGTEWERVIEAARDPLLVAILSNTTEAGFELDEADHHPGPGAPASFPAKLLAVLLARHEAGMPGPWILPCELIEDNAAALRERVLQQALRWGTPANACEWIADSCRWVSSLVDRIVPGPPREHPLLGTDPLLLMVEPFALWAVATRDPSFPFATHPAVVMTDDLAPVALRKVRLLNGAHSALVARCAGTSILTVREALEDAETGSWLEALLFTEIVPALEGRCEDPAGYAREVLDRFRNPFLEHQLSSIALNHPAKIAVRIEPTIREFRERFGRPPEKLSSVSGMKL